MIKFIALIIVIVLMVGTLFIISTMALPVIFNPDHGLSSPNKHQPQPQMQPSPNKLKHQLQLQQMQLKQQHHQLNQLQHQLQHQPQMQPNKIKHQLQPLPSPR
jgi:predicted PurR-regulated permease PerM